MTKRIHRMKGKGKYGKGKNVKEKEEGKKMKKENIIIHRKECEENGKEISDGNGRKKKKK